MTCSSSPAEAAAGLEPAEAPPAGVRPEPAGAAEWAGRPEEDLVRIAIVGAGGVGGLLAGLLARAGEEVQVIFNTYASPAGKASDERSDLAVWGAPELVIR